MEASEAGSVSPIRAVRIGLPAEVVRPTASTPTWGSEFLTINFL